MKQHTDNRDKVTIPEWAQSYESGDEISYLNPHTGNIEVSTVLGFSTKDENEGLPVIDPPTGCNAREIAVDQKHHQSIDDLKQNAD